MIYRLIFYIFIVSITDPEKITTQVKLITKYYSCGIAGFIEKRLKDGEMNLQEAQRYLDICTRDSLHAIRDLLL